MVLYMFLSGGFYSFKHSRKHTGTQYRLQFCLTSQGKAEQLQKKKEEIMAKLASLSVCKFGGGCGLLLVHLSGCCGPVISTIDLTSWYRIALSKLISFMWHLRIRAAKSSSERIEGDSTVTSPVVPGRLLRLFVCVYFSTTFTTQNKEETLKTKEARDGVSWYY